MKKIECPSCAMEVDADNHVCPVCGYEFPKSKPITKWVAILLAALILLYFLF